MQIEAPRDADGNIIGAFAYQGNVANRSLELLGKTLGMLVEKTEVTHKKDYENLSNLKLQQLQVGQILVVLFVCHLGLFDQHAQGFSEQFQRSVSHVALVGKSADDIAVRIARRFDLHRSTPRRMRSMSWSTS